LLRQFPIGSQKTSSVIAQWGGVELWRFVGFVGRGGRSKGPGGVAGYCGALAVISDRSALQPIESSDGFCELRHVVRTSSVIAEWGEGGETILFSAKVGESFVMGWVGFGSSLSLWSTTAFELRNPGRDFP